MANPRKLRASYENDRKGDQAGAEYLARLAPGLLAPIEHRSEDVQADLSGDPLPRRPGPGALGPDQPCALVGQGAGGAFAAVLDRQVPPQGRGACAGGPGAPGAGDRCRCRAHGQDPGDEVLHRGFGRDAHPQTAVLCKVAGVRTLTALCYMLTLESPECFRTSRP